MTAFKHNRKCKYQIHYIISDIELMKNYLRVHFYQLSYLTDNVDTGQVRKKVTDSNI